MTKSKADYNERMRTYMGKRYYARRKAAIAYLGGTCSQCNTSEELEFDHIVAADKAFNVGKSLASMAHEKLYKELDKCQLLCKKCHLQKSCISGDLAKGKARGEAVWNSVLTEDLVRNIRQRYVKRCRSDGAAAIARDLGVTRRTVQFVVAGETWRHVK